MQVEGTIVLNVKKRKNLAKKFVIHFTDLCANQDKQELPSLIVGNQDAEAYDAVLVVDCQL